MTDFTALVANAGDATITTFKVTDDLILLATTALPGASSTFAFDAERDLVYAAVKGDPPVIVTLRLDRVSGVLTEVSRTAIEAPLAYVDLNADGTVLLGASYHQGAGYTWTLSDGVLSDVVSRVEYANLHCGVFTDDGFVYLVSLGEDLVAQYSVSETGVLTPLDPPTVAAPEGSGPRHIIVPGSGTNAYLVTEFSGDVIRFARDAAGILTAAGSVSAVDPHAGLKHSRFGADPKAEQLIWGADVHQAGDWLVASERSASTLATISLASDGALGDVVCFTPTEKQPRGFNVSPDGTRVLAVGEASTYLALSRVESDGSLTLLDRVETGRGANWIRVF